MIKPHLGITARTGEKCPKSGVWKAVVVGETATMSVSRGNKMPFYGGRNVTWRLIIMF